MMAIDKQNNRHTTPPQTYIVFIVPRSMKGLGRCHKSRTWNNQGRRQQLLVISGDLIATTVTQRASRCHYRWYLFLFHWIIRSSIHLSWPRFVNSHPGLHITVLVITNDLITMTLTQREISCRHRWYLRFPHGMIHSLIQLSCLRFVNSHPALHLTQRMSCKLLQYPVGLLLILQTPCHRRPPMMEVAIFMDAWLMCLSWHCHNDNNML